MTNLTEMEMLEEIKEKYVVTATITDHFFLAAMGILALFVYIGFAFMEAGSCRSKNATNSVMKNVCGLFVGSVMYWATGHAFAYGKPGNFFLGYGNFLSMNTQEIVSNTTGETLEVSSSFYAHWFFEMVFAVSATAIASGAMAERAGFGAHVTYCFFMTGFIYPVASHWCWSSMGWLSSGAGTELSYQDFAGAGVVHVAGGTAALIGAAVIGPRLGRFHADGSIEGYEGHSTLVSSLGHYLLFVGLLGFNGGSSSSLHSRGDDILFVKPVANTLISAASGALTTLLICKVTDCWRKQESYWSLHWAFKGGLAGIAAVSAVSNDVRPWSALVFGIVAAAILIDWHYFLLYINVDDPVDAVGVHLGGGLTGLILGPIFAEKGLKLKGEFIGGVVYGGGEWAWKSLSWNLAGGVAIMIWTGVCTGVLFGILHLLRLLRVSQEEELIGCDRRIHNEPAYPRESEVDEELLLPNQV